MTCNGWPALLVRLHGEADSVLSFEVRQGRIHGMYAARNPEKLSHLCHQVHLQR